MLPKNTVGDFIKSVFSTLVNKDDEIFKALFTNDKGTGTVEKAFTDLEKTRNEWCNNSDIYNQAGEMLEKSLSYLSVLKRFFRESDESLKARNELLFYRNGDTLWGDKWDIIGLFKAYFGTDQVFIINNTNENDENLLKDGDFEAKNTWVLDNCAYDPEARFSERTGILFDSDGTCKQLVEVEFDSTYFLHFFVKGIIGIEITDNNGRYWNSKNGEFGGWQLSPYLNHIDANLWDAKSIYFLTDNLVQNVTINFTGIHGNITYIDYARLFKKGNYSSFTLLVCLGSGYNDDTIIMAPGEGDPVKKRDYTGFGYYSDGKQDDENEPLPEDIKLTNNTFINGEESLAPWESDSDGYELDYSKMSYIEQAHLLGFESVYQENAYTELLDIVKPAGIMAYIEILTRESDQ